MNQVFFITLLIMSIVGNEIKVAIQQTSIATFKKHQKLHDVNSQISTQEIKASLDGTKKYLNDYSLTIPAQFGSQQKNTILDTTSYLSWVFANTQTSTQCQNCPNNAKIFKCENSCQVIQNQEHQDTQLTDQIGYGGRAKISGFYGQESVTLMNLKGKKIAIGLINKLQTSTSLKKDDVTVDGVIGLSYGQNYIDYKNKKNAQVGQITLDQSLEQQDSIIQELHKQLNNVQNTSFSFKLEDQLSLIIIGEKQDYFADSKFKQFTNVGEKYWALNINKVSFGLDGKLPQSQKQLVGIFDTTTKFISGDQTFINNFKEEVKKHGPDCTLGTDGLLECQCENDQQYSKFQDIYFSFNLNTDDQFGISVKDYIYRDNEVKKCYIQIKTLSTDNYLTTDTTKSYVILPFTIFKQNYIQFDQDQNQISIAKSYQVAPDQLHIPNNTLIYVSIIGGLLLLTSLFLLVHFMQKVPYDSQVSNPATINQSAVQYNQPQQQQIQPQYQQQTPQYQQSYNQQQQQQYGTLFGQPQQQFNSTGNQGLGMFNTSPYRINQVQQFRQ